ncbi:MAG: chitinase [Lachnospiraceae bacterium]|nr:chitinase [Lachnospiraceae bacterium]
MKRLIPVLIAFVLIVLVVGINFVPKIIEKYSYSQERADLNAYYGVNTENEAAVILQDEILEDHALIRDGKPYISYDMVSSYFVSSRFYVNEAENTIRYVLPDRILECPIGESYYLDGSTPIDTGAAVAFSENGKLYLALDFVRNFTVFDYTLYPAPMRVQIYVTYEERQQAVIAADTQVRVRGGIKSEILEDVGKGDVVYVLEAMDEWSKVKTADSVMGYVENKRLEDYSTVTPTFADTTSTYGDLEYTSQSRDGKIVLGWHQVGGSAGNDTLVAAVSSAEALTVIAPTWFHLSGDQGDVVSYASSSYVNEAHARGLEVWALCDDFTETVDDYALFSSSSIRAHIIEQLVTQALNYGIDGLNIDFEKVSSEAGPHYVEFMRELSVACRQNNIVLSVDLYPPSGGTTWYNRSEQGVYCDYVCVMGYDEHYAGCATAGSVASIGYVEAGIQDTLACDVPASKLINGIPFYTRIWSTAGTSLSSEAVGMDTAASYIANHNLEAVWDEECCQYYAEYMNNDTYVQLWLEDVSSIQAKLDVMQANGIAGVACWKLTLESSDVWPVIAEYAAK